MGVCVCVREVGSECERAIKSNLNVLSPPVTCACNANASLQSGCACACVGPRRDAGSESACTTMLQYSVTCMYV
jgi:hypothetical protein